MIKENNYNSTEFLFKEIASQLHTVGKEIEFFWDRGQPIELNQLLKSLINEYVELYQELRYLDQEAVQALPDIDDLINTLGIPSPFPLTLRRYMDLQSKIDFSGPIGSDQSHSGHIQNPHHEHGEDDTPLEA